MIKLSRMADYGVVVLTELARDDRPRRTAPQIAQTTMLPAPTVSKILKQLAQADIVDSHRGTKGGYALTRDPAAITVAEIIGALDGPIALTDCVTDEGSLCEIEALCPTRTNWQKINTVLTNALGEVTLADMLMPAWDFLTEEERAATAPQTRATAVAE